MVEGSTEEMKLYVKAYIADIDSIIHAYNSLKENLCAVDAEQETNLLIGLANIEVINEDSKTDDYTGRVVIYSNTEYILEYLETILSEDITETTLTDEEVQEAKRMAAVEMIKRCITDGNIREFAEVLLAKWPESRSQPTELDAIMEAAEKEMLSLQIKPE